MVSRGLVGADSLKMTCIIGINPEERVREQEIIVDFRVAVDFAAISLSDDIGHTLDYTLLVKAVKEVAQKGCFNLVETLASRILDRFQKQFGVSWAWVKIAKPAALGGEAIAIVELERGQKP